MKTSHWKKKCHTLHKQKFGFKHNVKYLKKNVGGGVKGRLKTRDKTQEKEQDNKTVVFYSSSPCVIIWFDCVFQSLFSKLWLPHLYPP